MYVCLCNGYRDSEIRARARELGTNDPVLVYQSLGNGPVCGSCVPMAQAIVDALEPQRVKAHGPPTRLIAQPG